MKKERSIFMKESIFVKLSMTTPPLPNHAPLPCDGAMFLKLIRVVL